MNLKIKNKFKLTGLTVLILFFSGCTIKNNQSGGFFKSVDGGLVFTQEKDANGVSVLTGKKILSLEINPFNDNEIFVGTLDSGLFKSEDQGKTWLTDVNGFQNIYDIEFVAETKILYMAAKKNGRGKLLKSENGGEAWTEIYTEQDETSYLTSIEIHKNAPGVIYIANSKGGLFKSEDGGATWRNLYWAKSLIRKIEMDKINSNIIYLATNNSGLLMSQDGGNNFEGVIKNGYIYNVVAHPNREGFLYASTKDGLQKSSNKGADWEILNTLVKPEELVSRGLAINPQNNSEIYYTSGKTFYKSTNEGATWIPIQFDIGATIEIIKINPNNPKIIYLGTNNRSSGMNIVPKL